jgi:hypothetical protein
MFRQVAIVTTSFPARLPGGKPRKKELTGVAGERNQTGYTITTTSY